MTDWIEHDGGPQPLADDVWVYASDPFDGNYSSESSDVDWPNAERYCILNQHLIDVALLEGIRLGLEAAAKAALLNSHAEPFDLKYIDAVWSSIRALDPATIAREAVLDKLASEAQAQGLGYEKEADQ
jgi:hypothetical protein